MRGQSAVSVARTDPRPNYGSKRRQRGDGYIDVYVPDHPLARKDGYVFEHRKIAWDAGMLTDPSMEVHHINEVRDDNRLDNFEIKTGTDHARDHAEERGYVRNQFGTFAVKPRGQRQSDFFPSAGAVRPPRIGACEGCSGDIPQTVRRDARYCSERCRVSHWKRTNRARTQTHA